MSRPKTTVPTTKDDDRGYEVGYGRPPVHTRFQPGVSGNPAGRAKGSKNSKTLFDSILNEQIPVPGADKGLTVNAVHIKALGLLDVVIASATSDIHNC